MRLEPNSQISINFKNTKNAQTKTLENITTLSKQPNVTEYPNLTEYPNNLGLSLQATSGQQ